MRGSLATTLALFLATQGGQAFAAPGRSWSHSGARAHYRPPVVVRPVRVVPRYVYAAPYVPYYPAPYYPSPSYYPSGAGYSPSAQPAYIEQPQAYAPPPPPPPSSTYQPAPAQPGPYSVEQGTQYRYVCLDTRKFYPDTKECPSGWLTVLPGGGTPPR